MTQVKHFFFKNKTWTILNIKMMFVLTWRPASGTSISWLGGEPLLSRSLWSPALDFPLQQSIPEALYNGCLDPGSLSLLLGGDREPRQAPAQPTWLGFGCKTKKTSYGAGWELHRLLYQCLRPTHLEQPCNQSSLLLQEIMNYVAFKFHSKNLKIPNVQTDPIYEYFLFFINAASSPYPLE